MKAFRMSFAIAAIAAFCTLWSGNARAQSPDRKMVVTFSQPVEVPNLVLPAGTYVFKRLDTATPNLIQIMNADESRVFTTLLTATDYRQEASDDTVITFEERPNGSPKAIKDWFYPGDGRRGILIPESAEDLVNNVTTETRRMQRKKAA